MEYSTVVDAGYDVFHSLMNEYYRDGEDADTPQSEIDGFVKYLYELCLSGQISGCISFEHDPIGFVLWTVDSEEGVFSQKPGYGTILEIGMVRSKRGMKIGRDLVAYAEARMNTGRYYVCAYGPAEGFWANCGYTFTGELAENGLKIMTKGDKDGR